VVALRSKADQRNRGNWRHGLDPAAPSNGFSHSSTPWVNRFRCCAEWSSSTVVTGSAAELDELIAECERDDLPATRIPVDYASHSAQVEELRDKLRESLSGLKPLTADIAFISAVTGAGLDTSILDGDYWFANLRQPVSDTACGRTPVSSRFMTE